jgi:hypothetical protein
MPFLPPDITAAAQPAPSTQQLQILVHIDLLGTPDDNVFTALQNGMAARKFLTTLTTDDGQNLPLPFGTYSSQTTETVNDLSQSIYNWISREIWQQGAVVLVNELAEWSIAGNV